MDAGQCHASALRWYLAALLFTMSFVMGFLWNLMNALSGMVARNLGIHPDSIEDDTLVGTAVLLIASPVFAFWMANGRFRLAMLVSTLCSCASAWVLLLGALHLSGRMIFVSLAVNGLSGPMAMFGGVALSDLWFPCHQRTRATALLCSANYLGVGVAFLVGSIVIKDDAAIGALVRLSIAICAVTTTVFILTAIRFPSAPRHAPSLSQALRHAHPMQHGASRSGYFALASSASFWRIALCFALGSGIYAGWGGSLSVNLAQFGFTQEQAGWIGSAGILGGFLGGYLFAMLCDSKRAPLQQVTLALFVISGVSLLVFLFGCRNAWGVVPLAVASSVAGAGINGTIPLLLELAMEATYPIPTASTGNVMTAANSIGAVAFLMVPIDTVGTQWMNWAPFAACALSACLLAYPPVRCRRREIDVADPATLPILHDDGHDR
ncbi:unnamed protein product (mitochondrion) [Plasmodiophora brassicae]|uniref:Major facilitator superfamily (MFS) profile domain-containing protein n=1 Tax=Plasmodiophora brassicae TaxID=37360 RepID=A0A0G4IK93_PLABS|nr:hypothetical protein PBRA_004377 [Plasmodiophora brassicae]SPR00517.1 unnamed protein product [Plasmodiophora brassicae]